MNKTSFRFGGLSTLALIAVTVATLSAHAFGGDPRDPYSGPGRGDDRGGWNDRGGDWRNGPGPGPGRGGDWDRRGDDRRGPPPPPPRRGPDDRWGRRGDFRDFREAQRLVDVLYRGALNRPADPMGMDQYGRWIMNSGVIGLFQTARVLGDGPEFRELVRCQGAVKAIYNIYGVFFNRAPDMGGMNIWVQMLNQGRTGEVLESIVRSPEFAMNQLR